MQQRFFNYKSIIKSFDANQRDFAIAPSGVYAGFDSIEDASPGDILLSSGDVGIRFLHNETAIRFIDKEGDEALLSCIKSEQGAVITESARIILPITIEPTSDRIDAIVLRHAYAEVSGGTAATYEVVQGEEGETVEPTISIDTERTVIGWLLVKAGATDASGMVWLRKETPQFGNKDFRQHEVALKAMLSVAEHDTVLTFTSNDLILPFTGNIYKVKARATTGQNIVHQMPYRTRKVFGTDEVGAVVWLRVTDDSVPFILFDVNNMLDMGGTEPDTGFKWIKTGSGSEISVAAGGIVQLIERADYWEVTGVIDSSTHPYILADKINNKGTWWLESDFVGAVRAALGQTLAIHGRKVVNVNNSGFIEIGATATQRNVFEVTVPTGVTDIFGLDATLKFTDLVTANGAEVILKFVTVTPGRAFLRLGSQPNHFKAQNGFDYIVKAGSIVKCLQTDTGLFIISGDAYEKWITPSVPGTVTTLIRNGAFRYKIGIDGKIQFEGSVEVAISTIAEILVLPTSLFASENLLGVQEINVFPLSPDTPNAYSRMTYINDGTNVTFSIEAGSGSTQTFNFKGTYVNYR